MHPKARDLEFTGVQWAYASQGIEPYLDTQNHANVDYFLQDDLDRIDKIIRLDGIPGGIAELRIDDEAVAWARILLDGRYGFENIQRRTTGFQNVQVYLYQRSIYAKPDRIIDFTQSISSKMLNKGELLICAGAGESGNSLYKIKSEQDGENQTFAYIRAGINDKLTAIAAHQQTDENETNRVGLRASLGANFAIGVDLFKQNAAIAQIIQLQGKGEHEGKNWDLSLELNQTDESFNSIEQDQHQHQLHAAYEPKPNFRLGIKGRDQLDDETDIEFLKPWFNWRIAPRLNLSIDPSVDGRYETQIIYYMNLENELSFEYEKDQTRLSWQHNVNHDIDTQLGLEEKSGKHNRSFADLYWRINGDYYNALRFGVSYADNELDYSLSWNKKFRPGLELALSYNQTESGQTQIGAEKRASLTLKYDLAYNGKKFSTADHSQIHLNKGAINGQLIDQDGNPLKVNNVDILIDQRALNQSTFNEQFHIGNIIPGVYQLSVDEENLPIEYSVKNNQVNVEVARGAVTNVDFEVEARFGVAGKVLNNLGNDVGNWAGLSVEVSDHDDRLAGSSKPTRFGHYRVDGLLPGQYIVRLKDAKTKIDQQRITIENDFIFGVNLKRPPKK